MKKATNTEAPSAEKPAKKAPAKRASTSSATTPKKTAEPTPAAPAPAPIVQTTVVATTDVGFGNLLYIRGDGPGLSWDCGVPMECASSDTWTWATKAASRPFAYKVLVNDERWSLGDDYVAAVGVENTVAPAF